MPSSKALYQLSDAPFIDVPKEYDSFDREALFFLFTRPLQDAVLGHADHIEMHHWALVILFSDGLIRTMEGTDTHGKLAPHFFKESPENSRGSKYYKLIPMKTSPYKLCEVAKRNRLNGTDYSATRNNCQNWVKAAAEAISSNLATALNQYRTNGELNIIEKAGQCLWTSSRSSKNYVVSALKLIAKECWSVSTYIEEHKSE